jgi:hypothetical protein
LTTIQLRPPPPKIQVFTRCYIDKHWRPTPHLNASQSCGEKVNDLVQDIDIYGVLIDFFGACGLLPFDRCSLCRKNFASWEFCGALPQPIAITSPATAISPVEVARESETIMRETYILRSVTGFSQIKIPS